VTWRQSSPHFAEGIDVNARHPDTDGTALTEAASEGHDEIVGFLLEEGAEPNARTRGGATPLVHAVWGRHLNMARQLIAAGADANVRFNGGPLLAFAHDPKPYEQRDDASEAQDHQFVQLLLDAGADPNARGDDGWTFLMTCRDPELMRAAIAKGGDVDARTTGGTPLLSFHGNGELIRVLLEAGANKEQRDEDGFTPLMRAAYLDRPAVVAVLLAFGADAKARGEQYGEKVNVSALARENAEITGLLKKHRSSTRFLGRLFGN